MNYFKSWFNLLGCLNGGAQVRPDDLEGTQARDLSSKLEQDYHNLPQVEQQELTSSPAKLIYDMLLSEDKQLFSHVLYTEFHAVEKTNFGMKW